MSTSVKKGFNILQSMALHPGGMSLTEICLKLKLNKTTVFRYLATLEAIDMVEKKNSRYFLGIGLFQLGSKVPFSQILTGQIHPILTDLCDQTNETVNLGQLVNDEVLYLDKVESKRSLQIKTVIGGSAPLHCTALGKAIMSLLSPQRLENLLTKVVLNARTVHTVINRNHLLNQVQQIKISGYSIDNEELEEGLRCVAVPLYLENFNFYGSISLSGPTNRFTLPVVEDFVRRLDQTKIRIKKIL